MKESILKRTTTTPSLIPKFPNSEIKLSWLVVVNRGGWWHQNLTFWQFEAQYLLFGSSLVNILVASLHQNLESHTVPGWDWAGGPLASSAVLPSFNDADVICCFQRGPGVMWQSPTGNYLLPDKLQPKNVHLHQYCAQNKTKILDLIIMKIVPTCAQISTDKSIKLPLCIVHW